MADGTPIVLPAKEISLYLLMYQLYDQAYIEAN